MTAQDFRRIALSLAGAAESAHMKHLDFWVTGRIFAALGYPSEEWGVVKLPPDEQAAFVRVHPGDFVQVKGAWGRSGSTQIHLPSVKAAVLRQALRAAWSVVARGLPAGKNRIRRRGTGRLRQRTRG